MKRTVPFDPKQGYPTGKNLFYECLKCGGIIPSKPTYDDPSTCSCTNIGIDIDAGRVSIDEPDKMALVEITPDP